LIPPHFAKISCADEQRDTKCKVLCGLAARSQLLNQGKPYAPPRYTGPTPRMRSSSVPSPASNESTSLSRRNTSIDSRDVEKLEAPGPALGRRHTAAGETMLEGPALSRRRTAPIEEDAALMDEENRGRTRLNSLKEEDGAEAGYGQSSASSVASEWTTSDESTR
jgi:hypothetical protein